MMKKITLLFLLMLFAFQSFSQVCSSFTSTTTNTTTFIDAVSTTNGVVNISNIGSGLDSGDATIRYVNNFDTMSVSTYPGGTFDFNVVIQGGTVGCAVWVDWNGDDVFDIATETVFNTVSYGSGPFTGSITAPSSTIDGDYVMRVMIDWNDSNPNDNACSFEFASGRGEVEDYKVTVDAALAPSCIAPSALTFEATTLTTSDLSWSENGTATSWNVELVNVTEGETVTGTATATGVTNPYSASGLTAGNQYEFYVQADCIADGTSEWSGPFSWTQPLEGDVFSLPLAIIPSEEGTACETSNYTFSYDFSTGITDSGMSSTCGTTSTFDMFFSWTATSDGLIWNDGASNPGVAVYDATGTQIVCLGTFASVDSQLSGWAIGDELIIQVYDFGTTGTNPVSFCLTQYNLPDLPECATNITSAPDATCGSLDTVLSWDAVVLAEGYNLTVGTTTGGNDILDNVDVGDVLSYSVGNQTEDTTYYWTLTPYNVSGSAENCTENTYTTIAVGCYCVSTPSSNDGTGIGNLQVGTTDFPSAGDVTYEDFTGTPVDLGQGITANVVITFMTNYTYNTNIWIDLNDDLVFDDATELLYSGESPDSNTGTDILDASFLMPATATLGQHRMRIGTADTGQATPNSCYNGTYGVTMDVDVNIIVVSCIAPTGTATLVTDCDNTQFYVDVDVTGLGDGTSQINDGTNTYPATALGVVQVGPYADGTSVTLVLENGTDSACDTALGTFNYSCPPANDLCGGAIDLTVGFAFADNAIVGTNTAATGSGELPLPGCASYDPADASGNGGDVWFSAIVPANGMLTLEVNTETGGITDTGGAVYSGSCGSLTLVECNDDGSTNGAHPIINIDDMALAGQTVYFRVWEYGGDSAGDFQVSAYSPVPNDECTAAEALTIGVEITGDNTGATDSGVAADCFTGAVADLWYSFVAPPSGEVTVTTTAAQYGVYTDCAGTAVGACNTSVVGGLTDGTTYYVRVSDDGTARAQAPGSFTLLLSESSLSTAEFNTEALFAYYPNPVNDNLTLKAQKEISNVSVYNMLGQEVYRNAPNSVDNLVNMSDLQSGAYFVKVTIDNVTETIKVIKK